MYLNLISATKKLGVATLKWLKFKRITTGEAMQSGETH